MKGAIAKAEELSEEHGYFLPQQFTNPAKRGNSPFNNSPEIVEAFDGLTLDSFL